MLDMWRYGGRSPYLVRHHSWAILDALHTKKGADLIVYRQLCCLSWLANLYHVILRSTNDIDISVLCKISKTAVKYQVQLQLAVADYPAVEFRQSVNWYRYLPAVDTRTCPGVGMTCSASWCVVVQYIYTRSKVMVECCDKQEDYPTRTLFSFTSICQYYCK